MPRSLINPCSFILARPLHQIFSNSLESTYFPACCKNSFTRLIFKFVINYRPISILSTILKIFESKIFALILTTYYILLITFSLIKFHFSLTLVQIYHLTYNQFLGRVLENRYSVHSFYITFSKTSNFFEICYPFLS